MLTNQAGNYLVVIGSALGSVTSRVAALTVIGGTHTLDITSQPLSQTVNPGTAVNLSVTASGNPPPSYQWRRNGVNIPGANDPTFTLTGAQPTDGGRYRVVVASLAGVLTSDPADVVILSPELPFADNFTNRVPTNAVSGVGSGSNTIATREIGETNHFGKVGGKSVWYAWQAPANGIATFSSLGSSFDTLLAVYTGNNVSNLTEVASDDDRAGFLTSQVAFNAVSGIVYNIAIDGFAGASGNIVLGWNLDTTITDLPRFVVQPLSQTVTNGANVAFHVEVNSQTAATYQWFYNCESIPTSQNPTATTATLLVTNVQSAQVGSYAVRVNNATFRIVESLPAFLELGGQPDARSQDKLEDLFASGGSPFVASPKALSPAAVGASAFVLVSAGTLDSQVLNNFGAATQQGEPSPCGVIGGSSKWFGLQPVDDGVLSIDTIGSTIDTVLAVYTGTNILTLALIACDNNSAPDGSRSLVQFNAVKGTKYSVAIDGVNGAQGTINLNWSLGTRWAGVPPPSRPTVHQGGSLTLGVAVTNVVPTPSFQWRLNQRDIAGATKSVLDLTNIQSSQAGTYSLVVSNFAGAVTNTIATVAVALPIQVAYQMTRANGLMQFRLVAPPSQGLVVETSADLVIWTPRYTNSTTRLPLNFLDSPATNSPRRFYRVIPWP